MTYWLLRYMLIAFLSFYNRLSIEGSENLDKEKQYIFAANHFSFLDLPILIAAIKKPIIVPIKSDFFKRFIERSLLHLVNGVPVKNNTMCKESLKVIIKNIKEGKSLIIAPEGGISRNGRLQEFRDGASFIAFKTGIPVVPVAIINADKALPLKKILPRPYKIKVKIG
ncbi:1-acyl-sn-glycerol-3-phosphate acyltransferase, partial [bacterium]|nr:1-acyl-sn-glycerol-3-phosphate acyltransferase [bacterium]